MHRITLSLLAVALLYILTVLFLGHWKKHKAGDHLPMASRLFTALQRFPFAVGASIFGTIAAIALAGIPDFPHIWKSLLGAASLVLPLLVSTRLLYEKNKRQVLGLDILTIFVAVAGCAYFVFLTQFQDYGIWYRNGLWTIAAFLTILIIPFYKRDEEEQCWHFNAVLGFAFVIAVLSSFALFSGISAAFAGFKYLFEVKVPYEAFIRLWVVMAGVVAVCIFLAEIPTDIRQIPDKGSRSKIFEFIICFVFVPLVALYLIILYAYAGKIIIQGSWPQEGVARFILGFCGVGILSYCLSYGMRATENRFQSLLRKLFFPLVLPLTPMLFLSVWKQVSLYGVTEIRYAGILAAFWLAAISCYFMFSQRKDVRVVPASLCLIAILMSFGPWGALSTSARSQTERLHRLLHDAGLLVNGTLQPPSNAANHELLTEIMGSLHYLFKTGRTGPLVTWSEGKITREDNVTHIADKLGITDALLKNPTYRDFSFSAHQEQAMDVSAYRDLWQFEFFSFSSSLHDTVLTVGNRPILIVKFPDGLQKVGIEVFNGQQATVDFASFAESLLQQNKDYDTSVPNEKMIINFPNAGFRLALSEIKGTVNNGKLVVDSIKGVLMFKGD